MDRGVARGRAGPLRVGQRLAASATNDDQKGANLEAPYRALSYQTLVDEFLAALPSADFAARVMGENPARLYDFQPLDTANPAVDNRCEGFDKMIVVLLLLLPLPCSPRRLRGADLPSKNIHIVVAYAPGGTGDIVARLIAPQLGAALGQTVVIENRAGATGSIGTQAVVSAPADGHTLLLGQTGEISINRHWIVNLSDDVRRTWFRSRCVRRAARTGRSSQGAVSPRSAISPRRSSRRSRSPSLPPEPARRPYRQRVLKLRAKASLAHVPYKGAGPALNDLIGGHVDMYFPGFPAATPLLKAGTVKLLAVSSAKRSSAAPEIPTVAEAINDPNFDLTLWQGSSRRPQRQSRWSTASLPRSTRSSPRRRCRQAPRSGRRRADRLERAVRGVREIGKRQVRPDHQELGVKPE